MTERRRRLRLKIAEAEFKRTGNGLYAWDGLCAALEGGGTRVTLPGWVRDYLMDCIVELNRLEFRVLDEDLTPQEVTRQVPGALKLRAAHGKKNFFREYADAYKDAQLLLKHTIAGMNDEKSKLR